MSRWPLTELDIDTVQLTVFPGKEEYRVRWITKKINGVYYYKDVKKSTSPPYSTMIKKEICDYDVREKVFPPDGRIIKYTSPSDEHHMQFWRENKHLAILAASLSEKNKKAFILLGIIDK